MLVIWLVRSMRGVEECLDTCQESEGKTEAPHVCHCIEGARPTVYFPQRFFVYLPYEYEYV